MLVHAAVSRSVWSPLRKMLLPFPVGLESLSMAMAFGLGAVVSCFFPPPPQSLHVRSGWWRSGLCGGYEGGKGPPSPLRRSLQNTLV